MTVSQLFTMFRSRALLISMVFIASVLIGMAIFFPRQKVYEVSMLLQNLNGAGPYGDVQVWTIKQTVECGILNKEIARQAGLPENEPLPKLHAEEVFLTELVKIRAYATAEEIGKTKTVLNAAFEVLKEEFHVEYSKEILGLGSKVSDLEKSKANIGLNLKNAGSPVELKKVAKDLAEAIDELSGILASSRRIWSPQILRSYGLRVIIPPTVADSAVGPSNAQVMLAFGLLGIFAGLAAALYADERAAARKKRD